MLQGIKPFMFWSMFLAASFAVAGVLLMKQFKDFVFSNLFKHSLHKSDALSLPPRKSDTIFKYVEVCYYQKSTIKIFLK